MDVPINYLAVLVVAIVQMVFGFLWFGPLFGKMWVKEMGWSEAEIAAGREKMKKDGWKTYTIQAIGALLMAFVMAHSLVFAATYMNASGISAGLQAGFWNWLGFIAPATAGSVLWDGKSWKYWFLTAGYYLAGLLVMGIILALWM